jgi:hypothetical protein
MHFDTFQPIHMHSKTLPNPRLVRFHTSDTRKDTHELDKVQSIWNRSFVCWVLRWVEELALGFCRYETMGAASKMELETKDGNGGLVGLNHITFQYHITGR